MGFSIKEIIYEKKYLIFLANQENSGPWFSFKLKSKDFGTLPVILKNIEPTPIYRLVNSRIGTHINRITLDFDINEYFKKLVRENKLKTTSFRKKKSLIRLYIDIYIYPMTPYIMSYFTLKNFSDYELIDFSIYFVFDFDINGLEGYDNDYSGYDSENDLLFQYDKTGLHAGFSTIAKPTHYEACLTNDFRIDNEKMNLSNTLYEGPGEILSALQNKFKTLEPGQSFQTLLILSGGYSVEELIQNIKEGKARALKFLSQVNKSIKSNQRNLQEIAFNKINLQEAKDCNE